MKALVALMALLISIHALAEDGANATAKVVVGETRSDVPVPATLGDDDSQEVLVGAPAQEGLPSVEDLMRKKMDLVEKVEKIDKIEAAVNGALPASSALTEGGTIPDKKSYRPLKDKDPKSIQATPPFSINRGN